MYEKRNEEAMTRDLVHPLKLLTTEQFAALGGDAVVYVKPVLGAILSNFIADADFDAEQQYQLLMSADGTPLLVTDSADAVVEWLGDKTLGLATLH